MVDVITTLTFSVSHEPDDDHTRVVGTFPFLTDEDRDYLRRSFSAKWPDNDHFEIELQYARTFSAQHVPADEGGPQFEPSDLAIPLPLLIEEATQQAHRRSAWPVIAVEILKEERSHSFRGQWSKLLLHSECTVRVTQTVTTP